ncbi:MAG: Fe-S cluster assembly protein SufD, partial [Planctomycetota bacterium]
MRPVTKTAYPLASVGEAAADLLSEYEFGEEAAAQIVVVNGRVDAAKSNFGNLPDGVQLLDLIDAAEQHPKTLQPHLAQHADITANPFVALNTAYLSGGVFLHVPTGISIDKTIHILHVHTGDEAMATPRVLILAGDNAEFSVTESYVGPAGKTYFTNAVTEIIAGEDCRIDHNKLNAEGDAGLHVATMETDIGARTVFADHSCTIGSLLTRNDLNVHMNGETAEAILNGVAILTGRQHCDNHTLLDHQHPNCPSYELYKHVLDDEASGIFKGQIFVHQRAQKTDSKQNSRSLLLSDDAQMNSQPALEIYADDVKCTHGSTTGPLDDSAVFYLNSRGVSSDMAQRLLTYAFAADVTRR